MWYQFEAAGKGNERLLCSVGRALLIAQFFEDVLKRTLMWWDVASDLPKLATEEAWALLVDRAGDSEAYMERVLKRAIEQLVQRHGVGESETELLEGARRARNYIAHDAALLNLAVPATAVKSPGWLSTYTRHVGVLVRAYNLLSVWAYEFEEREPAPRRVVEDYPKRLEAWILSPMLEP